MEGIEKWETRRQVPESDPIYQEERERWKKAYSNDVFGARELSIYDGNMRMHERIVGQNRDLEAELSKIENKDDERAQSLSGTMQINSEFAEKMLREKTEYLRKSFKRLAEDLSELLNQSGYEDRKKYILGEVGKMFGAPEVQDELKRHFGDDLSEFTAINLFIKVIDGSISDEFMYAVAKRHVEDIREQEAQLEKIVEETKTEFKTAVTEAVANGSLPETAAEALHRIDSVVVSLSDRLLAVQSSKLGEADDSGKIRVSNEQLQAHLVPRLKKTIVHEFLHELSGKSVTVRTKIDDGPHQIHHAFHRKTGVALNDPDLWYSPNRWLNEAITEWLAIRLSGYKGDTRESAYKGSYSYPTERQELDHLFASGLEDDVVTNAYFENFSSDQPKGEKGKHFAKLVQRINAVEGQAGFAKLENEHIMHEVEYQMYNRYAHPAENVTVNKDTLPPEAKIFNITISIGTSEQTTITKKFVYMAKPITAGSITISVTDQWKRVESTLSYIEGTYRGKAKFSVVEE